MVLFTSQFCAQKREIQTVICITLFKTPYFFSDFHSLETDVKKEISLRSKVGSSSSESVLISGLNLAPALEFERSDATRRLRLVLSELLAIMGSLNKEESSSTPSSTSITIKSSEPKTLAATLSLDSYHL